MIITNLAGRVLERLVEALVVGDELDGPELPRVLAVDERVGALGREVEVDEAVVKRLRVITLAIVGTLRAARLGADLNFTRESLNGFDRERLRPNMRRQKPKS